MPASLATHWRNRRGSRSLVLLLALFLADAAAVPPLRAQPSSSCQFAVTAYVATQVELESARKARRRCEAEGLSACHVESTRIRELQLRLKMARDYIERYCTR